MKEVSEKCQKIYTNVKKSYLVILQAIKKIVYISNEDSLYNELIIMKPEVRKIQ